MKTIGIRELQKNPSLITKWLENKEYTLITKRNKPIGIAISFNDKIITEGLKTSFLVEAYKNSLISLGELARDLNMDKKETMKFLSSIGINVIDYSLDEEMQTIEKLLK
jgi:predicted HTH domain antitoxin